MTRITTLIIALCASVAQAQTCVPKVMGGTGANVDASLSITGAGWVSW